MRYAFSYGMKGIEFFSKAGKNLVKKAPKEWAAWSDREIASWYRVAHPFVAKIQQRLTCNITSNNRIYRTKYGTVSQMNTGNIGALFHAEQGLPDKLPHSCAEVEGSKTNDPLRQNFAQVKGRETRQIAVLFFPIVGKRFCSFLNERFFPYFGKNGFFGKYQKRPRRHSKFNNLLSFRPACFLLPKKEEQTAQNFMRGAERYGKNAKFAHLPPSVLFELVAPSAPEPVHQKRHFVAFGRMEIISILNLCFLILEVFNYERCG